MLAAAVSAMAGALRLHMVAAVAMLRVFHGGTS
jgi:hypothetical protein